jgi:hypothetical protein
MKIQHAKHLFNFKRRLENSINISKQTEIRIGVEDERNKVASEKLTEKALRRICIVVLYFRAYSRCEAKCDKTKLFAFVVCFSERTGEKNERKLLF